MSGEGLLALDDWWQENGDNLQGEEQPSNSKIMCKKMNDYRAAYSFRLVYILDFIPNLHSQRPAHNNAFFEEDITRPCCENGSNNYPYARLSNVIPILMI